MKKIYHLIGNAHLDPVWQWRVPEGLALVKSTYKAALDRMNEFPDYVFTSACAGYYKWIYLSEPEMFEQIKQRYEEGRWKITGGMWVQPDCNIPSGESFARHFLYSQKFFCEHFGNIVKTGYNVDSFGHNGALPQLFKKAGIDNYVYHRPNDDNEKPNLPKENLHYWESPDKSRVLAFRIPDGYGGDFNDEKVKRFESRSQPQMIFYGVGNHGGGPTIESLKYIEKQREEQGKDTFVYSGPQEYFDYIREHEDEIDIPVVKEDLQHHASGCYSANSKIKMLNRRAENDLIYAEKMDIMSSVLTKYKPKRDAFEGAWERVMFNQFHDILAGCSIKPAYVDAYNAFGSASETALELGTFAAERISWRVNTTKFLDNRPTMKRDRLWIREGEGSPMVVFNPHSFPVKSKITFGIGWVSGVVDSDDNDVPFQLVRAPYTDGGHYLQCMFEVELEPYGYATYFIFKDEQNYKPEPVENELSFGDDFIENSKVKVVFDKHTGEIISYFDKENEKEFAKEPIAGIVVEEDSHNDTWGHNVFDYNKDIGKFSDAKLEVVEEGYLRVTMKVTATYNKSEITQYFSLWRDSKKLEVKCKLNFGEHYKIAKLRFPVNVENPKAVYSMPFGFIEKEPDGLEEPAHGWIDVCDENNAGVALVNNGKYSFCVKDNEMRMVIARGCAYLDHYGMRSRDNEMDFIDQGEQEFEYALVPHDDGNYTDIVKFSEVMNMPLKLYLETHHKGDLPPVFSGMKVSAENVLVQAIKESEDSKGLVLRCIEVAGKETTAEIDFNMIGKRFEMKWGPLEIKTVFIPYNDEEIREIPLIEQSI